MKSDYQYEYGIPCSHSGCADHLSHPCEECGRYHCTHILVDGVKVDINEYQDNCISQIKKILNVSSVMKHQCDNYALASIPTAYVQIKINPRPNETDYCIRSI